MSYFLEITDGQARALQADLNKKYPPEAPKPVIKPKPTRKPKPPVKPSAGLMSTSFKNVWREQLNPKSKSYNNTDIAVSRSGISMAIILPKVKKRTRLKITRVDNTTTTGVVFGLISNTPTMGAPFFDTHKWGAGGGVIFYVEPVDAGRLVFFNATIEGHDRWLLTLQASFR